MPRYKKPESLRALERAALKAKMETSSLPPYAIPKPSFSDKDANSLTQAVIAFIKLQPNCYAWRVNSTGVYDEKQGIRRAGIGTKGLSDVFAVRDGRAWFIEIKIKADRLSKFQHKFKERVEAANGIFVVARNFDGFLADWEAHGQSNLQLELFSNQKHTAHV